MVHQMRWSLTAVQVWTHQQSSSEFSLHMQVHMIVVTKSCGREAAEQHWSGFQASNGAQAQLFRSTHKGPLVSMF